MRAGHKRMRTVIQVVAIVCICVGAVALLFTFKQQVFAYESFTSEQSVQVVNQIYVNDKYIGSVHNIDEFKAFLAKKYMNTTNSNGGQIYLSDQVSIIKEFDDTIPNDSEQIYEQYAEMIPVEADAVKATFDNGTELIVRDRSVFDNAVDILREEYRKENNISDTETGLIDPIQLEQNIIFSNVVAPVNQILDQKTVLQTMVVDTNEMKVYQPNLNENLDQVANENGLTVDELLILNPSMTEQTLITPNMAIEVAPVDRKITFSTLQLVERTMDVPFSVEYIDDDNVYQGDDEVIQEGIQGQEVAKFLVQVKDGNETIRYKQESMIIKTPTKAIIRRGTKEKPDRGTGNFIWPNAAPRISTNFGDDELGGSYRFHNGMDMNDYEGSPIWAADNGTVVEAGYNGSYGYTVLIDHNNGFQTRYAHMMAGSIVVHVGEIVPQGTTIGQMGSTGLSTGTHLHFEVIINGTKVDPRNYLPKR